MRYYELREANWSLAELKKGIALIKRDCQPYLSQVSDPMKLRRGVSRTTQKIDPDGTPVFNKKKAHLDNRYPRGSYMSVHHDIVNEYFTKTFGFPFRNGVMAIGDQIKASEFGTDVAIFPIGEFKFLWSPRVRDLNNAISDWSLNFNIRDSKNIINKMKKVGYRTTDLQKAIDSKNEIMIWAEEYYTLDNTVDRMLVKKLLR